MHTAAALRQSTDDMLVRATRGVLIPHLRRPAVLPALRALATGSASPASAEERAQRKEELTSRNARRSNASTKTAPQGGSATLDEEQEAKMFERFFGAAGASKDTVGLLRARQACGG